VPPLCQVCRNPADIRKAVLLTAICGCRICDECRLQLPADKMVPIFRCKSPHHRNGFFGHLIYRSKNGRLFLKRTKAHKSSSASAAVHHDGPILGRNALLLVFIRQLYSMYPKEVWEKTGKEACVLMITDLSYKMTYPLLKRDSGFLHFVEQLCSDPLKYLGNEPNET
jgi:hypothetical protein